MLLRLKYYVCLVLYYLGISTAINSVLKRLHGNKPSLIILCYHSVEQNKIIPFKRQLSFLSQKGFKFISGAQLCDMVENADNFDTKIRYICITFDDCFENNYSIVREILIKRNIPAIFFAPSRKLGMIPDWYGSDPNCCIMSAKELKEMSKTFDIGAHTMHHIQLGKAAPSEIPDEILGSKADLATLLEREIEFFAYPYGSYNKTAVTAVEKAQFKAAFTVEQHTNYSCKNRLLLGRYIINPDDVRSFRLKVNGGYDWVFYIRKLLQNRANTHS